MPHALGGDGLAKGHTAVEAFAHEFQGALGSANGAHAVVDTSRAQATLGNFKAAAFTQQDVVRRHAHVLEFDFHVAVRRVVVTEHGERAQHRHAGGVGRDDDHALL